jgi:hypothetical protein
MADDTNGGKAKVAEKIVAAVRELAKLEEGPVFEERLASLARSLKIREAALRSEVENARATAEAEPPKRVRGRPFVKGERRPGQFVPGKSGNPSGTSKSLVEITRLARDLCPRAIQRLATIMDDPRASKRDQIHASIALLERGAGRAVQPTIDMGNLNVDGIHGGDGLTALLLAAKTSNRKQTLEEEEELAALDAEADRLARLEIAADKTKRLSPPAHAGETPPAASKPAAPEAPPESPSQHRDSTEEAPTKEAKPAAPEPAPPKKSNFEATMEQFGFRPKPTHAVAAPYPKSAMDAFPPDKVHQGDQEIVRLTRIPGGHGIRRVRDNE